MFAIPGVIGNHVELDSAAYKGGVVHVHGQAKIPVPEHIGPQLADLLDTVAKADDDQVFSKDEMQQIALKGLMLGLAASGVGK